jgi:crotonobetainyl-CoA:carnitine CoA-transferase CaiB-like acyl-CoA transferase
MSGNLSGVRVLDLDRARTFRGKLLGDLGADVARWSRRAAIAPPAPGRSGVTPTIAKRSLVWLAYNASSAASRST